MRRPLALVGALAPEERDPVARFLLKNGIPAYCEGPSGLREDPRLTSLRLHSAERLFERASAEGYAVDCVLRLGRVPTLRAWRDLEERHRALPVISFTRHPFSGLGRESSLLTEGFPSLLPDLSVNVEGAEGLLRSDRARTELLDGLLADEPRSEPALVRALSSRMARGSRVYVGNSLPIREWDLAAARDPRALEVWASRGLNGIDGQISTFLGFASPEVENWGLFGDLTALYDLSGPWVVSQLERTRLHIAVVNNGGGKIFDRMFESRSFQNNHSVRFDSWAALWGLGYERWESIPESSTDACGRILEIVPCAEATARFWKRLAQA